MTTKTIWLSLLGPFLLAATLCAAGMQLFTEWGALWRIEWIFSFFLGILVIFLCQKELIIPLVKRNEEDQRNIDELGRQLKIFEKQQPSLLKSSLLQPEKKEDQQKAEYRELRKQFEEKSEQLASARKELFLIESELLAQRKENEERALEENIQEKGLSHHFIEIQNLEEEVGFLQEIITGLLAKKKTAAPRKPRKKREVTPDLFESRSI
jgi:DNA gyrase/topoisomerase IV subunit A